MFFRRKNENNLKLGIGSLKNQPKTWIDAVSCCTFKKVSFRAPFFAVTATGTLPGIYYTYAQYYTARPIKLLASSTTTAAAVCVVFTLNRSFYPTTSVHPGSVLIFHPRYKFCGRRLRQRRTKKEELKQPQLIKVRQK